MRIALLTFLLLAGCTVGEVGTANNTNGCADRLTPPGAAHTHTAPVVAGNPSNKGQNCIVAACHLNNNLGLNAPGYQFAGTLYLAGTTNPQAGAQIRLTAGAMTLTTYTDADGNFSFPAGSLPGQFTAMTDVSACPTITNMVTPLVGGNGGGAGANSCNLCHTTAAGAQAPPITL